MERISGPRAISDDVVKAKTGKSSAEWYSILDAWGVKQKGHTLTAKYLAERHGVSPWWAQTVVIRYEWQRGLRTKVHRDSK